jgi:hypothetical protein
MAVKKQPRKLLKKLKSFINIDFLDSYVTTNYDEILKKILKIKDALANEGEQSLKMFETYAKYTQGEVSDEEMDKANKQFGDFLKTIGLGVFAILPGSPITIPLLVKLSSKFGIDIIPDSFKSTEAKKKANRS